MKRNSYITWDQYFMGVAQLSALRSKDPNTQVGACIVNQDKRIVGIGYNGLPRGCEDDVFPWEREAKNTTLTKYPYVVHAEANAILNATKELKGSSIFVTLFPCNECMKLIIQSGITEIVYASDKYEGTEASIASVKMMEAAGIQRRMIEISDIHLGK